MRPLVTVTGEGFPVQEACGVSGGRGLLKGMGWAPKAVSPFSWERPAHPRHSGLTLTQQHAF